MQPVGLTLAAFARNPGDLALWGPGPLLVVRPKFAKTSTSQQPQPDEDAFVFDTPSRATLASTSTSAKAQPEGTGEYLVRDALVIPVRKGANPFPFISAGRARNNDVCVQDPSISKVHAYFIPPAKIGASWAIKDAKSLNGTFIMLGSGALRVGEEPVGFETGSEIRFGVVKCLFTDRETLASAVAWASVSWRKS